MSAASQYMEVAFYYLHVVKLVITIVYLYSNKRPSSALSYAPTLTSVEHVWALSINYVLNYYIRTFPNCNFLIPIFK